VGVGVIDEPTIRGTEPESAVSGHYRTAYDTMMDDARRRVEARLEQFALQASQHQVAHKLLEDIGLPYEEILREAERFDLVMLGQQTYFHFETKSGPDDTLDRVLRRATRPVVAVPAEAADGSGVLIGYDGSDEAARAVQAFLASGLHALGDVTVVTIDPDSSLAAAKTADRAIEFLRLHDVQARSKPIVSSLPPGKVILQTAHKDNAELIVMGAKGKSPIWEFFFGSATQRALRESKIPLFMYH
jgi:nucleotide-binding universal stress UspA family protein